jgi:uncharacterized membrane protein
MLTVLCKPVCAIILTAEGNIKQILTIDKYPAHTVLSTFMRVIGHLYTLGLFYDVNWIIVLSVITLISLYCVFKSAQQTTEVA